MSLAVTAGNTIMNVYKKDFDVEFKDDRSPLTEADKKASALIMAGLKSFFPDTAYLCEEEKDDVSRLDADECFIIDPLDGTKEFVKRNGEFTVNIALARNGKSVLGVIYVPVTKDIFYAAEGLGSFLLKENGEKQRLHVSDKTENLIIAASKSHRSEALNSLIEQNKSKIKETISFGSSLKGCMVASGAADIYYRFGLTCEWDTCAMQCIAEQAGAIVLQTDRTPLTYNRRNTLNEKGFLIVNRKENIWI
jgi:3'(2'), 5'-bisphosphate nucleotidase